MLSLESVWDVRSGPISKTFQKIDESTETEFVPTEFKNKKKNFEYLNILTDNNNNAIVLLIFSARLDFLDWNDRNDRNIN